MKQLFYRYLTLPVVYFLPQINQGSGIPRHLGLHMSLQLSKRFQLIITLKEIILCSICKRSEFTFVKCFQNYAPEKIECFP